MAAVRCRRLAGLAVLALVLAATTGKQVVVKTEDGPVAGSRDWASGVSAFLGIPFAEPPLGKLRFQPPRRAKPWKPALLDATYHRPDCMQSRIANAYQGPQSEDCLYLNVWTPAVKGRAAVMVFVHGGAWQIGGSSRDEYQGHSLAARYGVVVVSMNYRLGAFGFLVSTKDGLYGNYGLMDQRIALEWVQRNARSFGADPDRVTLFGESAGAKSVGLHLMMDSAGRLFHRAIMQSNPYSYQYRTSTVASFLGEALRDAVDCEHGGLRCLQEESAEDIIEAMDALRGFPRSVGDFFTWSPVLSRNNAKWARTFKIPRSAKDEEEAPPRGSPRATRPGLGGSRAAGATTITVPGDTLTRSEGGGANAAGAGAVGGSANGVFLRTVGPRQRPHQPQAASLFDRTERPWNITVAQPLHFMKEEDFRNSVPVIVGTNFHEGQVFVYSVFPLPVPRPAYWGFIAVVFRLHATRVLRQYATLAERVAVRDQQGRPVDYRPALAAILNDYMFRCPSWHAAQLLAEASDAQTPVYVYEFVHPTVCPGWNMCDGLACHTVELPFAFNQVDLVRFNYSTSSIDLQDPPPADEPPTAEPLSPAPPPDNEVMGPAPTVPADEADPPGTMAAAEAAAPHGDVGLAAPSSAAAAAAVEVFATKLDGPATDLRGGSYGGGNANGSGGSSSEEAGGASGHGYAGGGGGSALPVSGAVEVAASVARTAARQQLDGRRRWLWQKLKKLSYLYHDRDVNVARAMSKKWAAFAIHGDPNYDLDPAVDVEWPAWVDEEILAMRARNSELDRQQHKNTRQHRRARREEHQRRQRQRRRQRESAQAGPGQAAGAGRQYLEIGSPFVARPVGRDCYCEFWDSLDYIF